MPDYARRAAAHRDSQLRRVRRLSLRIAGSAAAASLGLGAAFAHSLPGHSYAIAERESPRNADATGPAARGQAGSAQNGTQHDRADHGDSQHLAPPRQRPAPASAPPVVSSGGS